MTTKEERESSYNFYLFFGNQSLIATPHRHGVVRFISYQLGGAGERRRAMRIFSFDAETNGLWGQPFAVAALVYDGGGNEVARFVGRSPIEGEVDEFVADNVLPQMRGIEESHDSYNDLLRAFAEFYLREKQDSTVIAHMAVPVESNLLRDMHSRKLIGDWDGPFPLIDLAGMLMQAGEDPTSVDGYAEKHGMAVDAAEFEGGSHNPLYDSAQAAQVYLHLMSGVGQSA